ncbi:MAG: RpoN/RPB10 RNA polymerase subunit family protein [Candidatus Rehaiarchaeum fermentans]|nr:DNA-directed RNA polymerase subunit N [Candidatus Rehaiarchaeum fermentans]MCW1297257.1 DNA-directed RNA polymerase subunit N [Candidatus Rehaiarchaeum fermentans]MCW1302279.1 DNA-directed RNA polymerase subunit N [Candidatus Rehaiarchaeum fermentans]
MIPMRCYSCGKPISQLWEEYEKMIKDMSPQEALDKLGLRRYCCRAIFLGTIDDEEIINFKQ